MPVSLDETDVTFKAFPELNRNVPEHLTRSRLKLTEFANDFLTEDTFRRRIVRALCETKDIGPKEVLESFEFYARVRRRIRAPQMADLCCGHGLVGLLFAAMERCVERVVLMDSNRSRSANAVFEGVTATAPWIEDKVRWIACEAGEMASRLTHGTSITAIHACGSLTDDCIEIARSLGSRFAVMPCCYGPKHHRGPEVLERMLDPQLVVDIDRTYRLESQGYSVDWQFIPRVITPRNRILIGMPSEAAEEPGGRGQGGKATA